MADTPATPPAPETPATPPTPEELIAKEVTEAHAEYARLYAENPVLAASYRVSRMKLFCSHRVTPGTKR